MRPLLPLSALLLALASASPARAACDTSGIAAGTQVAELTTSLGTVCFALLESEAPAHVENFLHYLENDLLLDTYFHRVATGFVLQGAGFTIGANALPVTVPTRGVVVPNEPCTRDIAAPPPNASVQICSQRGNERGTVALAKQGGDPSSGSTNWFVNLADNRVNLDNQNGGFTVFARVTEGMDVVDEIAALTIATRDDYAWLGATQANVSASQFTFTTPVRTPFPYDVAGEYGCFDPLQQITILNPAAFPNTQSTMPVADPIVPSVFFHTLSAPCGTATTRATFVADPGAGECTDVDRIGVATTGPKTLRCVANGTPGVLCATADHAEFSCVQAADALAQRELWRADFKSHFVNQAVYITAATATTVPEPGAAAAGLAAIASLWWRRARAQHGGF